jgi:PAS domain S-box-containing protein
MHIMVDSISDQPLPSPEAEQSVLEDHIALIYETAEERLAAITPLIKVGLEKGELCLYISNEENDQGIVEALKAEHIDVEKAVGTGGLILTSKKEMYFKLGRFDPDWTIRVLNNIADLAKSYGFTAMRIMSEMAWTQEQVPGVERWPEYEAKMNSLNVGISLRIICQYDRTTFPPAAMLAAIRTHPKVVSQGSISKNIFYVPAERLLSGDYVALELERILDSIRLSNSSESELQNRDQLIDQMRRHVESSNAAKRTTELALEDSRRRFSEFAERASDWAWELDEHGTYTYSSPRVKDILGLQPEEVLGRTALDLVSSQEEADRVSAILTRTMGSRTPITALEKEMRHKDGHAVFLEMSGTPLFNREGDFLGYRGIDRDITGRKSAKLAIDESRKKAEESVAEVQARDQRIQGLEEAISQLRAAQADRDAALASINEALKGSQLEMAEAGEDLERLRNALLSREEEIAATKAAMEGKQAEIEKHRASLTLLQQNLMDKEGELAVMRSDLEQVKGQHQEKGGQLNELTASYKVQALELIAVRGSLSGMGEGIARKEEELVTLRQQMTRMETEIKEATQACVAKAGDLVQAQAQIAQLNEALERKAEEIATATGEIQAKDAALAETLATVSALQITLTSRERELSERVGELEARQEEVRQAAEALESTKAELAAKEAALVETIALAEVVKADLAIRSEEALQAQEAQALWGQEKGQLSQLVQERDSTLVEKQAIIGHYAEVLKDKGEELRVSQARLVEVEQAQAQQLARAEQQGLELSRREEELLALRVQLAEQQALVEQSSVDRNAREDELAALKSAMLSKENDVLVLQARLEQSRLDLIAQDAVVFGLREALLRRDDEIDAQRAAANEAREAMAASKEEALLLRRSADLRGSELWAVRAALDSRDTELSVKGEALYESNGRYQALFEQAGAGIVRIGLDGRLIEANDKFYSLLGYVAPDLIGTTFREFTHRDDLADCALLYQRLVSGEVTSASLMKRYVRKLGSTVWANVTMSSVRDAQGNLRYIMAIVDDRTDQMLAELALKEKEDRESEERYKSVIENVPEGVWVLDTEGRTTFVNQRVAAMLGYPPEEILGQPASNFMDAQWMERQEGNSEGLGSEVKCTRRDGSDLWVIISSMPILDREGQSKGAIGLVNDITALKAKQAQAEVLQIGAQKEAARLRAIIAAVSSPFAVVAVDGMVTMASPALERLLGTAVEGRPISEVVAPSDLGAPFRTTVTVNGQEKVLDVLPSPLPAGDGTVLTFGEVIRPVEIARKEVGNMPSESLAHDLNNSLTVIMGSVSLAKEYVIPEGRMYNKLRQIETASVTARDLAGRLMATAKGGPAGEAAVPEPPTPMVKGKGRILLMDDDESILEATGDLLRYLGYVVEVARDGEEALALCKEARDAKQPFELAILDQEISSGLGGNEVGKQLRAAEPALRLIISTGYANDPALGDPTSRGFVAAIPKPYAADVLSRVVASALTPRA